MSPLYTPILLAALVTAGTWLAVHATSAVDLDAIPRRCRRRLRWWHANATRVYAGCLAITACFALVQLSVVIG